MADEMGRQRLSAGRIRKQPPAEFPGHQGYHAEAADDVVAKVKTFEGIEDIKYYKDTVDQLMRVSKFMQVSAMIIIVF
jgi:hypothetical protein